MHNSTLHLQFFKISFSIFLLIFCSASFLQGQITINEEAFTQRLGKKYKEVIYETDLDIHGQLTEIKNAVGADQMYDFGDLNYIDSTVILYELMDVNPNDPFLANAELQDAQYIHKTTLLPGSGGVMDTTVVYQYTSVVNGSWIVHGAVSMADIDLDGMLDSLIQFFLPPNLQVQFPVTMNSEWHDSTSIVSLFDGMEFVSAISLDSSWVTGYGTLITPYATGEALRVDQKYVSINPFTMFSEVSNDITFVTENDEFSATIVVEDGRAFYSVRTEEGTSSTVDIQDPKFAVGKVAPNPFTDFMEVEINMLESSTVRISLLGANGAQNILVDNRFLTEGLNKISLPVLDIPSGAYFLEIRSKDFVQHIAVHKF